MSRRPDHLISSHAGAASLPEAAFTFCAAGDSTWSVLRFEGREAVSDGFALTIDLVSDDVSRSPEALLDCVAELTVARDEHARTFSGVVRTATDHGVARGRRMARVLLVPELSVLSDRVDSRVFVDRTAVDLAREVLRIADLYVGRLDVHVARTLPRHERLVQYRETDLAFISRWLEREGIAFFVRHDVERGEVLVLSDRSEAWERTATMTAAPVCVDASECATSPLESLRGWRRLRSAPLGAALVADYDWTRPTFDPNAGRARVGRRIHRDCSPGLAFSGDRGDGAHAYAHDDASAQSTLRMEASRARAGVATAEGNLVAAGAGQRVEVELQGETRTYAVIAVTHRGVAPEVFPAHAEATALGDRYRNALELIPQDEPFRPERRTPWPRVAGVELARVVGPDPNVPMTEFHGCVKVRFRWDERGESPAASSCWVPVVQTWAGSGYGFTFIPRAGMEVAVEFVGGDPDRPVVVGALYNGENRHAEELPHHRSRSGIRTASLDDVHRFNELVFDDETHREEVYLRAQRNLRENVLADHHASVGHDRTEHIGHDHAVTVSHDARYDVRGLRRTMIDGDDALTVMSDRHETVVGRQSIVADRRSMVVGDADGRPPEHGCETVDVALDHLLRAGRHVVIEAEQSITLRVGRSTLVIDAETISAFAPAQVVVGNGTHARVDVHGRSVELHEPSGANVVLHGGMTKLNT